MRIDELKKGDKFKYCGKYYILGDRYIMFKNIYKGINDKGGSLMFKGDVEVEVVKNEK